MSLQQDWIEPQLQRRILHHRFKTCPGKWVEKTINVSLGPPGALTGIQNGA